MTCNHIYRPYPDPVLNMRRPHTLSLPLSLALLLTIMTSTSCSTTPSSIDASPVSALIEGSKEPDSSYRLQVGDSIGVHFLSYPDLEDVAAIGPDGRVALRLVNDFGLAGMTLAEATREINDQYERVLNHPAVTLTIHSYSLQQIYVDGEVNSPGVVRSTIPLTASAAIAQAGGMKLATAHPADALLLRRRADGALVYYRLQFRANLPSEEGDPVLRSNDVIYVPRTAIASVADFLQANLYRIVPFVISPTFVLN